jgi:type II secretory pathway pseudopilin PulG
MRLRTKAKGGERSGGFTLVEFGIVLAVTTILASVMLPDFIESARVRMAGRAAEDVLRIQEAARWYYNDHMATADDFDSNYWPGQVDGSGPSPDSCPALAASANAPILELVRAQYLDSDGNGALGFSNPWGQGYRSRLQPMLQSAATSTSITQQGCGFVVETQIPAAVAKAFLGALPGSTCPTVGTQWARCETIITRPGSEAGERALWVEWQERRAAQAAQGSDQ